MSAWTVSGLTVGVALLIIGAELLVRGAAAIATRVGIAPVVIGLTVVAFGTSAPELAVSVSASLGGSADVAVGNVVGSNIGNILLILGLSAVAGRLTVDQRIIRIDIPLLLVASVVVYGFALDNSIGRLEGAGLFAGIVVYTLWLARSARSDRATVLAEYDDAISSLEAPLVQRGLAFQTGLIAAGFGSLLAGSQLLVTSAVTIAEDLGVSDLVIGLTVVAIGTSLPELATSLTAAIRGQRDIAVGNVVGSNLFNLLSVLGGTAIVSTSDIPVRDASLRIDLPVMLAATLILVPMVWRGFSIERWEGALLASCYAAYLAFLVFDSNDHRAAVTLRSGALVVGPILLIGFTAAALQAAREHRRARTAPTGPNP